MLVPVREDTNQGTKNLDCFEVAAQVPVREDTNRGVRTNWDHIGRLEGLA